MLTSAVAGLGLGLSLIIAIGAQNLFVLRQGIRREYAVTVAAICAVSDAVLIVLGVSGLGLLLQAAPWLIDAVRWAGALFLAGYAVLAARRALRPTGAALRAGEGADGEGADGEGVGEGSAGEGVAGEGTPGNGAADDSVAGKGDEEAGMGHRAVATSPTATAVAPRPRLTAVILTCLALTWLNPHVYLDTVFLLGSIASTHGDLRWWFAAGAVVASALWFFTLAIGARTLGRWLSTPRAWRILDGVIAVVMLCLAVSLILPR